MEHASVQHSGCAELSTNDLLSVNGGEMVIPAWWVVILITSALANSGEIIDGFRDGYSAAH